MASSLLTDCQLATYVVDAAGGAGQVTLIERGALVIADDAIAWAGQRGSLPKQWQDLAPQSCGGRLLTPGLVDAFTSLHPGPAQAESDDLYVAQALAQVAMSLKQGVTWRELKTGAHTDSDRAMRQLLLARRIQTAAPQRLSVTLRAAQVREDDENHDTHIDVLCNKLILGAYAAGLLDAVEVLCDDGVDEETGEAYGFSLDDASTLLEAAYRKKIPTRLGCEHHTDTGGVALAPSFYARCAAYLNFCDELGVEALARARTTAMLLPLAHKPGQRLPPVDELRRQRVSMALGTAGQDDASPSATGRAGEWPSPLLAARRACEVYGLSGAEAFAGITAAGARVLGGPNADPRAGTLSAGASADLALWDATDLDGLLQAESPPVARRVWVQGRQIDGRD
jgi:imidazolonepropionase